MTDERGICAGTMGKRFANAPVLGCFRPVRPGQSMVWWVKMDRARTVAAQINLRPVAPDEDISPWPGSASAGCGFPAELGMIIEGPVFCHIMAGCATWRFWRICSGSKGSRSSRPCAAPGVGSIPAQRGGQILDGECASAWASPRRRWRIPRLLITG